MRAYLFTLLLLSGCGHIRNFELSEEVHAVAKSMFTSAELSGLSFGLGDISSNGNDTVGMCDMREKQITVQRDTWRTLTAVQREMVIAHEVGHCAFGLPHYTSFNKFSPQVCPDSIMHPDVLIQSCWIMHKDYYLQELRGD